MFPKFSKITELKENHSTVFIFEQAEQLQQPFLKTSEWKYVTKKLNEDSKATVYKHPGLLFFCKVETGIERHYQNEKLRKAGAKLAEMVMAEKIKVIQVKSYIESDFIYPLIEGIILGAYSFPKYKKEKKELFPDEIQIVDNTITANSLTVTENLLKAVYFARDLVNEPLSYLTATRFSSEMKKIGAESGLSVEVFEKKKIEALKMGGLLAVNKGSIDPPTFTILEWSPPNAVNKKPFVLVGKGVVYDTGGLSLKPTPKSMDYMKCDMAGGAVVAGTLFALASNKIPLHVVGLVPATDNRPDGNAYVPGDIITMFDGTTVEVKNTDAEGRLLLADALSYAKKFHPELVIDIATLTGGATIVAGNHAIVGMGNTPDYMNHLKQAGNNSYERIIEVPLWEEYAKPLKSEIADLNNLGAREGQSTIAGKFLEHFTAYNWIHLDVAAVSFRFEKEGYLPAGGTGFGIRLLYKFLTEIANNSDPKA
ncbi:MAG: peptidase M17 [Draconibacterium sp.]|nr:MAG: peptidase M17 [Draconibacterium sp.]